MKDHIKQLELENAKIEKQVQEKTMICYQHEERINILEAEKLSIIEKLYKTEADNKREEKRIQDEKMLREEKLLQGEKGIQGNKDYCSPVLSSQISKPSPNMDIGNPDLKAKDLYNKRRVSAQNKLPFTNLGNNCKDRQVKSAILQENKAISSNYLSLDKNALLVNLPLSISVSGGEEDLECKCNINSDVIIGFHKECGMIKYGNYNEKLRKCFFKNALLVNQPLTISVSGLKKDLECKCNIKSNIVIAFHKECGMIKYGNCTEKLRKYF